MDVLIEDICTVFGGYVGTILGRIKLVRGRIIASGHILKQQKSAKKIAITIGWKAQLWRQGNKDTHIARPRP